MNCQDVLGNMGFECKQLSPNMLRVWSPFTYGGDGEVIGFYVERTNAGYRVTDGAEALRHAESMGIDLSKKRLELLRRIAGDSTHVSPGGEITASCSVEGLSGAIASILNAATAVSHLEFRWTPRGLEDSFSAEVGAKLDQALPQVVKRNVTLVGASGHQLEIPFAVTVKEAETYIQPVAYGEGRVNWDNVYRGFGKMMDLKNLGTEHDRRIVVVDDRGAIDDIDQSVTFLSACANVVRFRGFDRWLEKVAA